MNEPVNMESRHDEAATIDSLIVAFHEAYRSVSREADTLLTEHGLARSHHKVLFHVARNPLCRVSEVQSFVGVSRQALQRPVAELHREGLVETLVAPENRRIHLLKLTAKGIELERAATELIRAHFRRALQQAGEEDLSAWRALMSTLSQGLE